MPLHVARLRDSDLAAEASPEACWYAVLLWAASWHQVPAASLPDNDAVLTRLLGLGRDVKTFRKHRDDALRGFVLCSDGRLYHPVVAEEAVKAWNSKLRQRWQTECARIKKWNQRHGASLPFPTFEQFLAGNVSAPGPENVPDPVPGDTVQCPSGNSVQETGTGTETGKEDVGGVGASADDWPAGDLIPTLVALVESPWLDPAKSPGLVTSSGRLAAWKRDGASWLHDVVPVVTGLCRSVRQPISSWKFFDQAIARSISDNRQALNIPEAHTHDRPGQNPRNDREARRGVWAEVLAEERGEGVGGLARAG